MKTSPARAALDRVIRRYPKTQVLVVGDLMLDRFIFGTVSRISPEAPVPVVDVEFEQASPGGAGNVAANIAALGGRVKLAGFVGRDAGSAEFLATLRRLRVDAHGIFRSARHQTTEKTRVVADEQHIVRIDRETPRGLTAAEERALLAYVRQSLPNVQALVLSDYAKGLFTPKLAQALIRAAKAARRFVVADPKPKNALFFRGASLVTPNLKEALTISGADTVSAAGKSIQHALDCPVLITQGPHGMTLFWDRQRQHFPTKAREVFDVAGAGDTVAATIGLSLGAGATLPEAVVLANHAAGIVVSKLGTATASRRELKYDLYANGS